MQPEPPGPPRTLRRKRSTNLRSCNGARLAEVAKKRLASEKEERRKAPTAMARLQMNSSNSPNPLTVHVLLREEALLCSNRPIHHQFLTGKIRCISYTHQRRMYLQVVPRWKVFRRQNRSKHAKFSQPPHMNLSIPISISDVILSKHSEIKCTHF